MSKYVSLFPNNRRSCRVGSEMADFASPGHLYQAIVRENGIVDLECSAINASDAWVVGHGKLSPTDKRSPKYPDLNGTLKKADEDGHYAVAGWWKETRDGVKYLSLSLT